jgi:hypothetical protein
MYNFISNNILNKANITVTVSYPILLMPLGFPASFTVLRCSTTFYCKNE